MTPPLCSPKRAPQLQKDLTPTEDVRSFCVSGEDLLSLNSANGRKVVVSGRKPDANGQKLHVNGRKSLSIGQK